jgi:TolB-like protein
VAYVLEGSTRLQGRHLRVSAQLIKVSDQSYVWAESYDSNVDDILRVQELIACEIARAVHQKIAR